GGRSPAYARRVGDLRRARLEPDGSGAVRAERARRGPRPADGGRAARRRTARGYPPAAGSAARREPGRPARVRPVPVVRRLRRAAVAAAEGPGPPPARAVACGQCRRARLLPAT